MATSLSRVHTRWIPTNSFFGKDEMIVTALGVSVAVTVIGTVIGVALTMLMGYVLSRSTYKLNGFFTMVVFIPMIFNGGMISSYVVNTQFLNLKNSIWALILPLCVFFVQRCYL